MDETIREKLLSRFAAYLDSVDHDEAGEAPTIAEGSEGTDLFSVFVELAGLRSEVRTESRLVKEALDQFRGVFDTLQSSHQGLEQELKRTRAEAHGRERALLKPLLLDILDIRDRLAAGAKTAVVAPRWYERIRPNATHEAHLAWREGMRMTLRRIDKLLADRSVVAVETVGRMFDPRLAAAVSTVEDPAAADGMVVEELRPGFLWQGELLRPAEVIVARRAVQNGDHT